MELKGFAVKVRDAVEEMLGEKYDVQLQEVQKNNGVVLQGLLICRREYNVTPTIYLNSFWEAYKEGAPFAELMQRILQIYHKDTPDKNIDMSFFRDFTQVRDRICFRLIHREKNNQLLQRMPHIAFLDLAISFYYAYEGDELGKGVIPIFQSHADMWETGAEELLKLARENTPRLFPFRCSSMESVLREVMDEQMPSMIPMQILSNENRTYGAACILYPHVLEKLAEEFGQSFYLLPSSVHEFILLKDQENGTPEQLKDMIAEVNSTQLAPEEVLSDSLYYYDGLEKKLQKL